MIKYIAAFTLNKVSNAKAGLVKVTKLMASVWLLFLSSSDLFITIKMETLCKKVLCNCPKCLDIVNFTKS